MGEGRVGHSPCWLHKHIGQDLLRTYFLNHLLHHPLRQRNVFSREGSSLNMNGLDSEYRLHVIVLSASLHKQDMSLREFLLVPSPVIIFLSKVLERCGRYYV
jgi:hypothetical protein